jgi:hypothetical protein
VIAGAPPPGTLQKRPRPANDWQRRVEWARQPAGGWKQDDFCMTPSGRLARVLFVSEQGLALAYIHESPRRRAHADVSLKPHLCRWISPREARALKQPNGGVKSEGGADAAA